MTLERTFTREVDGITWDMRSDGTLKYRMHKLVFRYTKDEKGKSISLCDELRGIMLEIPLEPVEDLVEDLQNDSQKERLKSEEANAGRAEEDPAEVSGD